MVEGTVHRALPRGIDFVYDIAKFVPRFRPNIIFDVGANIGQSAVFFLRRFPGAKIYCFEPVNDTFTKLKSNLKNKIHVKCFKLAIGSKKSKELMILEGPSEMYYMGGLSANPQISDNTMTELVDVLTLDEFCSIQNIDQINFLKIDTEGGDLEVLNGAIGMLKEQKIDIIEVEAGMNPNNKRHVPFEILKKLLESYQYFLFGIYEQINEHFTNEPHLRRSNSIYISQQMIDLTRKCTNKYRY